MGGKRYSTRTEAEAAQMKILGDVLAKCRKADGPTAEQCVLVSPTRQWLRQHYIKTEGPGSLNEDMFDYLLTTLERSMETEYAMIEASGVFKNCTRVTATIGNGETENLSLESAFEIRAGVKEPDGGRIYTLYGPKARKSKLIGSHDVYYFGVTGWDLFVEWVQEIAE